MVKLKKLYDLLLKAYGHQGWWPLLNSRSLVCEYKERKRTTLKQAFEIACGAVLTQNTNWYPNVVRTLQQLKCGRILAEGEWTLIKEIEETGRGKNKVSSIIEADLLNAGSIRDLSLTRLKSLVRPAGFFNQKASYLKALGAYFLSADVAAAGRDELLKVRGVGRETADSILLYGFSQPVFVIDAYTRRIVETMGLVKPGLSYEQLREVFEKSLPCDVKLYQEFHALLVEHAKRHYSRKSYGVNDTILSKLK